MVFLKVLEHWLHARQRIRTDEAGLRAKEAGYRADEVKARKRELAALQDIERLKSVNDLAEIDDVELHFD